MQLRPVNTNLSCIRPGASRRLSQSRSRWLSDPAIAEERYHRKKHQRILPRRRPLQKQAMLGTGWFREDLSGADGSWGGVFSARISGGLIRWIGGLSFRPQL